MPKRVPFLRARGVWRRVAIDPERVENFQTTLHDWFSRARRTFVWRSTKLSHFHVLVTEILLAKSRAELVEPVAKTMYRRFASPEKLSRVNLSTLERIVYPLGLYKKRSLHLRACAEALVAEHSSTVPNSVAQLMTLPFVGRYAANAIANVAFDAHVPVVDANVARVYGRVFSLPPPHERLAIDHDLWAFATRMLPSQTSKEFNWALLDLGGTICTAKAPACERCPMSKICDQNRSLTLLRPRKALAVRPR